MKRLAALAALKLSLFLKGRVDDDFFRRYSRLIALDVTEEELADCPNTPEELFEDEPALAERFARLCSICGGDEAALTAIELYLLARMDARVLDILRDGVCGGLTIETAGRITWRACEPIEMAARLRRAFERVSVLLQAEPSAEPLCAPFALDGRLAAWLAGDDAPDERLCAEVDDGTGELPAAVLTGERVEKAADVLREKEGFSIVHISGESGSGRRHTARHLARRLGRGLLLVPFDAVGEDGALDERAWRRVLRELLLTDRILCLHGLRCAPEKREARLRVLLRQMERDLAPFGRAVFVTTEEGVKVTPFVRADVFAVSIPRPTILQSASLWRTFAGQTLGEEAASFPAESLAAKMTLTAGQMERIVQLLRFQNPRGQWSERDIFKLCYQVLDDGRYENIRFVDTAYTWDDLLLSDALKGTLRDICAQVEHQGLVLDEWGLRRRYPYGRCVSVLMSGPPGTGKTMTAQVLASKLGLELYKVDLSQIVDKYIGETEKRLGQVFDQAEKSNLVLFFDEADALLGKRSEVKDAKDKYANTEVAYLLQRMEEYRGVVLMATNQAGSMDSAFLRRFRYHLTFTLPDEAMRRKMWEAALDGIPSDGVQMEYLARQFDLSGAQIKNIALNAAYRAASDGGVLRMVHLVRAVFQEFHKEGKVMLSSEFGEYGVMMSDYLSGNGT